MAMTLCFVLVLSAIPFFPALAGTVEEDIRHSRERDVTDHPELMEEAWLDEYDEPFVFAESSEVPDDIEGRADIAPMSLDAALTRGRAAAYIVMRRENALTRNANVPHMPFTDVPLNDWARNMIAWANNRRWVNGIGDNRFNPGGFISRQDFAVLIVRAFDNQTTRSPLSFSDRSQIAPWAVPYIERAVARGWIRGFPDGTFRPNSNISRRDGLALTNNAGTTRNIGTTIFDPVIRSITWNGGQGGTTPSPNTWHRPSGHVMGSVPGSSRSGHTFMGWYSGTYRITANTILNTSGTALARWPIWHDAVENRVSFWPGAIRTHTQVLPAAPANFLFGTRVFDAQNAWGNALGLTIGSTTAANAQIRAFGGTRAAIENELEYSFPWGGLAYPPTRTWAGTITVNGVSRTVQRNSGQARIFVAHHNNANIVRMVTAHEIGHAVGWAGHSPLGHDVMFYSAHQNYTLQARERMHLRQIYDFFR